MGDLSRRDVLKLSAAGAGATLIPGLAACGSSSKTTSRNAATGAGAGPANLTGRVVHPHSARYDAARTDWDRLYSASPLVIVFVQDVHDVVNAVTWSRQNDVALRVRSGRHHLEGWSNLDGGIVIDVSELKGVQIDAAARTAKVGAGLSQHETVAKLGAEGLAVPTGSEASVGLAGATLGGGFGFLTRSLGLACDNLLGAEVVVPSGADGARAIAVDEHDHADLLWALRGAGNGNFGVATSLTYRLHPLRNVGFLTAKWNGLKDLPAVFEAWQREAPAADQRLTSVLEVDPGDIQLFALLSNGSPAEARKLLEPVLSNGRPEVSAQATTWPKVYATINAGPRMFANWKFFSQFVTKPFPPEAISSVAKYMSDAPSAPSNFFCSSFGGAVAHAPSGGSAFPHRNALFYSEPSAGWNGDAITPKAVAWVAEFGQALAPYVDGAYANIPNKGMADWETAYWGANVPRLREVKAQYDPDNVFQFEQSIQPAAG